MLSNRCFKVKLNGNQSRWRNQRIGLPQCSVLSPLLFNVYMNDQPLPVATNSFIYADDMCLATKQDVPIGGDYLRQRTKRAGRVLQREPSASKSRKDPANGIPSKEPPSRPQTGSHLERHVTGPHALTCLPWHHTRPLTHMPKPLVQQIREKSCILW